MESDKKTPTPTRTTDQMVDELESKLSQETITSTRVLLPDGPIPFPHTIDTDAPMKTIGKEVAARIDLVLSEDGKDIQDEYKEHEITNDADEDDELELEKFVKTAELKEKESENAMLGDHHSLYHPSVNKCHLIPIYPSTIRTFFPDGQHKDQVVVGCRVQLVGHCGFIKKIGEELPGDGSLPNIYSVLPKIESKHIGYIEHENGSQYFQSNFIYYRCTDNQTMFWLLNKESTRKIDAKLRGQSAYIKPNSKYYDMPYVSKHNNRQLYDSKPGDNPMVPDAVFYKLCKLAPHQPVTEINFERQRLVKLYQKKMELLKSKRKGVAPL